MSVTLYLDRPHAEVFTISDHVRSLEKKEYVIEDRIASGGNAVVHKCIERITGAEYAIKFQLAFSQNRTQRFRQEIELLKKVRHDQLISYIDQGIVLAKSKSKDLVRNIAFLVMPLADSNLKDLVNNSTEPLLYEDYIAQFKGLAQALGVLHQEAVHRDIKPENILVRGETWLLSDFGLCKYDKCTVDLSDDNEPIGPRYWMSPEAINHAIGNDDEISKSSDVYQLCSVFWFVITRRHPTGCVCSADWGNGPKNLYDVIYTALSHDKSSRPSNGHELKDLLEKVTFPSPDSSIEDSTGGQE